jgi:hypothetical protein
MACIATIAFSEIENALHQLFLACTALPLPSLLTGPLVPIVCPVFVSTCAGANPHMRATSRAPCPAQATPNSASGYHHATPDLSAQRTSYTTSLYGHST